MVTHLRCCFSCLCHWIFEAINCAINIFTLSGNLCHFLKIQVLKRSPTRWVWLLCRVLAAQEKVGRGEYLPVLFDHLKSLCFLLPTVLSVCSHFSLHLHHWVQCTLSTEEIDFFLMLLVQQCGPPQILLSRFL